MLSCIFSIGLIVLQFILLIPELGILYNAKKFNQSCLKSFLDDLSQSDIQLDFRLIQTLTSMLEIDPKLRIGTIGINKAISENASSVQFV